MKTTTFSGVYSSFDEVPDDKPWDDGGWIDISRDKLNFYDLFPTILNLLDFSFKNNRLGLGYSAIKDTDIDNYKSYFKNLEKNIENKSDRYVEFWK